MTAAAPEGHESLSVLLADLSETAAQLPVDSVLERLGANPALGLTPEQTSARLSEFGPNKLEPSQKTSLWRLIWAGVREPFVILLFIAGCLAIALNEVRDGLLVPVSYTHLRA